MAQTLSSCQFSLSNLFLPYLHFFFRATCCAIDRRFCCNPFGRSWIFCDFFYRDGLDCVFYNCYFLCGGLLILNEILSVCDLDFLIYPSSHRQFCGPFLWIHWHDILKFSFVTYIRVQYGQACHSFSTLHLVLLTRLNSFTFPNYCSTQS